MITHDFCLEGAIICLQRKKPSQRYPPFKMHRWRPAWGVQPVKRWTFARFSSSDSNNRGLKTIPLKSGRPTSYPNSDNQLPSELAPPLVAVALPFDLPDVRKEKRLMRRREKLPDFLRLLVAAAAKLLPMLEMSSWDWLRQDSFSRCLLRNSSFDPLCRKPTAGSRQNMSTHSSGDP